MKSLWLSLFVVICPLFSGSAWSQDSGNHYPFAGGKIEALDPVAKQITISSRSFAVTNTTYLIANGAKTTFDKLKVGDPVKLNYFTNTTGQAIIRRLKITPPEAP